MEDELSSPQKVSIHLQSVRFYQKMECVHSSTLYAGSGSTSDRIRDGGWGGSKKILKCFKQFNNELMHFPGEDSLIQRSLQMLILCWKKSSSHHVTAGVDMHAWKHQQ